MVKQLKEKRKALYKTLITEHPEIPAGKRFVGIIALIWIITRVLLEAAELWLMRAGIIPFSPFNLVMLLVLVMFVSGIYSGYRAFSYLPIAGGAMMVIQFFSTQLYLCLGSEYLMSMRIYALAFIVAAWAQVILMVILIVSKKAKPYFSAMESINKKILDEQKQSKL